MKRSSKIKKLKISPLLLAVLIGASVITSAAILGFFWKTTTSVTTEELFLFDNDPMEETLLTHTITNAVGGNVYTIDHWLNASEYIQDNITLSFTWSGNVTGEGVTAELLYLGSPITELMIEPDTDYQITERYTLDPMIESGSYECILTVDV